MDNAKRIFKDHPALFFSDPGSDSMLQPRKNNFAGHSEFQVGWKKNLAFECKGRTTIKSTHEEQ